MSHPSIGRDIRCALRGLAVLAAGAAWAGSPAPANPEPMALIHPKEAAEYASRPVPHAPVAAGKCSACHADRNDPKKLVREVPALCYPCHARREADMKKPHVHPPFQAGDCTACHDPHGADERHLLGAPVNEACGLCHHPEDKPIRTAHGGIVVAKMECIRCHTPHGSALAKLIREEPRHPPFEERACDACHDDPGKDGAMRLKGTGREFCMLCHSAQDDEAGLPVTHPPFVKGECWTCHDPHVGTSGERKLLRANPGVLCRQCHPQVPGNGHPVVNHPTERAGVMDPKEPTRPFGCPSCHQPHGSAYPKMRRYEPGTFCLECHPR